MYSRWQENMLMPMAILWIKYNMTDMIIWGLEVSSRDQSSIRQIQKIDIWGLEVSSRDQNSIQQIQKVDYLRAKVFKGRESIVIYSH